VGIFQHGFAGNKRMNRLYNAAANGQEAAPLDLRYLQRPLSQAGSEQSQCRTDVFSFLSGIYESVAETLPDVRDSTFEDVKPEDIPPSGLVDPYALELNKQLQLDVTALETDPDTPQALPLPREAKSMPRKKRRSIAMNLDRSGSGEMAREEKFLPPGCMKEYYMQYRAISQLEKPASFATFWREPLTKTTKSNRTPCLENFPV